MGTSYYRLKSPITAVRVEELHGRDRVTVYTRKKNSGMLLLEAGDAAVLVEILCQDSPVLTISDIFHTPFPLAGDIDPDEIIIDDAQWLPHRAVDIMSGKRLKRALEINAERLSRKLESDVGW